MIDLPPPVVRVLRLNAALALRHAERGQAFDPWPVLKLFNPAGAASWIATELADDGDTLFGLADLGFGCPELGSFSLFELASVRLPFGLGIERDVHFEPLARLSVWAEMARRCGSIIGAEAALRRAGRDQLPSEPTGEGG